MPRIVVFLDYANIDRAASERGAPINFHSLLEYLSESRFLVEAHCFFPIDPRNPHSRDREMEDLWLSGFYVHTKVGTFAGETYKCNFDVEMTMEVMRVAQQTKPDIVVLASVDSDFVPLILELRRQGIRVEVAAFRENAGREVILKSSGFIDLNQIEQPAPPAPSEATEPDPVTPRPIPSPEE